MRIIGGTLRGRRFEGPPGDKTRPTSDRVREALASALEARGGFADRIVLDLFAGTGALAFEALSRGATRAVLVESDRRVAHAIGAAARALGLESRTRVHTLDLERPGRSGLARLAAEGPFDLVFADPPYALADRVPPLFEALHDAGAVAEHALLVCEYATRMPPQGLERLGAFDFYRYGDTSIALGAFTGAGVPAS